MVLLLAAIVATGLASLAVSQFGNVSRYEIYKNEFEVAEAVLAKVFAEVSFLVEYAGPNLQTEIANIRPPVLAGYTVKNLAIDLISSGTETITGGNNPWNGLQLYVIRYRVTAQVHQASNTSERFTHPGVALKQDFELQYVPLFLFAIFYNGNLEIHPGMTMTVTGRVHTNANLYCGSDGGTLRFRDYVTAVGEILHQRHPDAGLGLNSGNDSFWNGTTDIGMRDAAGLWIDHNRADWATLALSRWNGHVYDSAHQVDVLNPPIPRLEDSQGRPDAHALIERAQPSSPDEAPGTSLRQEKLEYKAGLKIVRDPTTGNVTGYNQEGSIVPLTYPDPSNPAETKSVFSETTFYDAREAKTVSSIDINIANLIESGKAPANGILYLSNEGANGVVRLTNASRLPTNASGGFSIATDDPLYIKGNFNTDNKEYAMVAADAIGVLSTAWNDANSPNANWWWRNAGETTLNGVFLQGIVPSQTAGGSQQYSGGAENYFRLLENWSGVTFHINGSQICLWESQEAKGFWHYGYPVYTAPRREWAWDPIYGGMNGPPGAPRVYHIVRRNWNIRSL
jgi:hypothetical protein